MSGLLTDSEKLAYAAGLIDGEGCVYISGIPAKKPTKFSLRVSVAMTVKSPLIFLQENYGGTLRECSPDGRGRRKVSWVWSIGSFSAADLLEKMLPVLLVKKQEAMLGLILQSSLQYSRYVPCLSSSTIQLRRMLWEECRLAKTFNG